MKKYILSLTRTNPWDDPRGQVLSIHDSESGCFDEAERLMYAFTMRERDNLEAYVLDKARMEVKYITGEDTDAVQTMHFGITEWDDAENEPHENSFLQCTPETDCEVAAAISEKLGETNADASLSERFDAVAKMMGRKFTTFTADEHDLHADEIAGALLETVGAKRCDCRNVLALRSVICQGGAVAATNEHPISEA